MNGTTGRQRTYALCGILAASMTAPAAAQIAPPFSQLLAQAQGAPRVTALTAEVARAEGAADQARARRNPNFSVYAENFAGDAIRNASNQEQITVQLDWPIEVGGKRSARIAAGAAALEAARARGRDGRLRYATDLARAYAGVEIAVQRIDRAEDEVAEMTDILQATRALVAAGKEARMRQVQAETELATLQADVEMAKARRIAALARLSALAGSPMPFAGVAESLLARMTVTPASGPADPMQASAVRIAEAERDAAARAVTVQQRLAIPDVTASMGVRQLRVANGPAIVAGIGVPLPLFDRNRGNIAAARAELQGAEARAAAARLEAEADARAARALVAAADLRSTAVQLTLTTAEEGYRLARIAYRAGKSPLLELIAARSALGHARADILDAAAARFDARADLALVQGVTITGEAVR